MNTTSNQPDPQLEKCVGCPALPGEAHGDRCDHARCPECGEQLESCFDHEDSERPALWHGIDQRAEVAQARDWWTTAVGIDHLVEDYTRVLYAIARDEVEWDPEAQRYAEPERT